ncbi:MAG: hypothetical protein KatS3mg131_0640 [Candidatus Tectimicrobiota bacterium]|nr:MAG: hypothetical protein KatS3mg131_0640 [Candidatus Tectomicrobia bacterium]
MHNGTRWLVLSLCLWIGVFSGWQVAAQPPRVLTLEEAVTLAVQHSPQVKEEQFAVLVRQSQKAQGRRRPLCPT